MASKHIGVPNALIEQPKYKYVVNSEGLVTITTSYACPADRMEELMPPIGATHSRFRFALLSDITGVREEGDLALIDCVFKGPQPGTGGGADSAVVTYELVASTREEPIETHESFKDIDDATMVKIKEAVKNPVEGQSPALTDPAAITLYAKLLRGQTSYLRRSSVWRESSTASSGFGSVSDVGKISTPAGGAPSNSPGDWLLLSCQITREGSAYRRVREWMASGDEGWDSDIYS